MLHLHMSLFFLSPKMKVEGEADEFAQALLIDLAEAFPQGLSDA